MHVNPEIELLSKAQAKILRALGPRGRADRINSSCLCVYVCVHECVVYVSVFTLGQYFAAYQL